MIHDTRIFINYHVQCTKFAIVKQGVIFITFLIIVFSTSVVQIKGKIVKLLYIAPATITVKLNTIFLFISNPQSISEVITFIYLLYCIL